jgi:hypothetical protein
LKGDFVRKDLQITFLLILVILISGCTPQDKAGEASSIRAPIVKTTVPVPSVPAVKVIGPPNKIIIEASPATIRCGEKSTITVTVKDSAGQNVQDHLNVQLSATTNPPWRIGTFEQPIVVTQNGVAKTTYKAHHLPSNVQLTGFIGGLFGLGSLQVFC